MALRLPLDYNVIRAAISNEVQRITNLTCILEQPNAKRPPLPYFSFRFVAPAIKSGDDSSHNIDNGTVRNVGGQRKILVDFNTYGCSHEDAYNYMALLQSSFELETVQGKLRESGIAIWLNGSIRDVSQLLNSGFEGRATMEVAFGVASNLYEDLSSIDQAGTVGTVTTDQNETETINVDVIAP